MKSNQSNISRKLVRGAKSAAVAAFVLVALLATSAHAQQQPIQNLVATVASTDVNVATFNFEGMAADPANSCANQTDPAIALSITSVGNITRAGLLAATQTLCVYPANTDASGNTPFDGTFSITTSKSGQLYGTYSGTIDTTGTMQGKVTITGGTIDFASASGSGTLAGTQTLNEYGVPSDISMTIRLSKK